MRETFLVEVLRLGGCTPNQAAAFERALEDRPIAGIGVLRLTDAIRRAMMRDALQFVAAMAELERQNMILENEKNDPPLFTRPRLGAYDIP